MSLKALLKKIKGNGLDAVDFSLRPLSVEQQFTGESEAITQALFFQSAFKPQKRRKGVFSPSELSTENPICARKMYYRRACVVHDPGVVSFTEADNRMMRLVDLGTMVHLYIQVNLQRAGMLIAHEVPVEWPEYGIHGTADGIVQFEGYDSNKRHHKGRLLLEIKTINDNGFTQLKTAKPDHIKQATIYGAALGLKSTLFIYYNKNNSDLKTFIVDNDMVFLKQFLETAKLVIDQYNQEKRRTRSTKVELHNIPPRICGNYSCERATNCPYRNTCFNH